MVDVTGHRHINDVFRWAHLVGAKATTHRFEILLEDLLEPVVVASFGFVVLAHESPRFHRLQAMYLRLAADFSVRSRPPLHAKCTFRSSW